jgi:hypothetical protein
MIDGAVLHLCDAYSRLTEQIAVLRLAPMAELTADERKWFVEFAALKEIMARREILGDDGLQSAVHILVLRLRGNAFFNREMLARELEACRSQFLICLSKRKFAYTRPPGEAYFEKADLLGVESFLMIPDARDDVRDAGNCIAAELYSAAVYHLMRAAEHGLRRIAQEMKIKQIVKGKKTIDVTESTWGELYDALRAKLESTHQKKRISAKRAEEIKAYSDLASDAKFLKNAWRDHAMHLEQYSKREAMNVFERVKGFMQGIGKLLYGKG